MKCIIIARHLLVAAMVILYAISSSLLHDIVLSDHILYHFIFIRTSLYRLLIYHLIRNAQHIDI